MRSVQCTHTQPPIQLTSRGSACYIDSDAFHITSETRDCRLTWAAALYDWLRVTEDRVACILSLAGECSCTVCVQVALSRASNAQFIA